MIRVGLKHALESGGRCLNDDEYALVQVFRKMYTLRNKNLGVAGRQKLRDRSDKSPRYGITEFDAPSWMILLNGSEEEYEEVLFHDVSLFSFARYQSAGIPIPSLIIEFINNDTPLEDAIQIYKNEIKDSDYALLDEMV